jgi:hypothetical protein
MPAPPHRTNEGHRCGPADMIFAGGLAVHGITDPLGHAGAVHPLAEALRRPGLWCSCPVSANTRLPPSLMGSTAILEGGGAPRIAL